MNSLCESMNAAAIRILSRTIAGPRAARARRFYPLAEAMEARAVLSNVAVTPAIVGPVALAGGPAAIVEGPQPSPDATAADVGAKMVSGASVPSGPRTVTDVVVNGQVEVQPGDVVVNGQVEVQPGDALKL